VVSAATDVDDGLVVVGHSLAGLGACQ
jgi:hypothetical protein